MHGFELVDHDPGTVDWSNDEAVAEQHYAEMEALARQLTGCDHALIAGHICRNPQQAARHADFAPIQYVHSDFTESYGDLVRDRYVDLEPPAARALQRNGISAETVQNARRLLILQFWRNIGPVQMDQPIAFSCKVFSACCPPAKTCHHIVAQP